VSPDWPIETERLLLRPFTHGDLEGLYAMHSDVEVSRYLYNPPRTLDETRDLLSRKIAGTAVEVEGDWLSAAVVERANGECVGDLALHYVSELHHTAEVGFVFHPRHQRQGFATEAAAAFVGWAFAAGFHRVIGRTEARNAASARVLEKLGMRPEAHFVENEWVKGEWQSELVYAILEREWR
jgi:RimJ/RimL family protein N-acetyltransferase